MHSFPSRLSNDDASLKKPVKTGFFEDSETESRKMLPVQARR
jgi:hypothetical protein